MSADLFDFVVLVLTASKVGLALLVWRARKPPIHAIWFRDLLLLMAAFDALYWFSLSRGSPLLLGIAFVLFLAPSSLVFSAAIMALVAPSAVSGVARRIWWGGALFILGWFAFQARGFVTGVRLGAPDFATPDLTAPTLQATDINPAVVAAVLVYFFLPILLLVAALLFRRDRRLLQARLTMLAAQLGIIIFHALLFDSVPQALSYLFGSIILTPAIVIVLASTMPKLFSGFDDYTRTLPLRTKLGLGFGSLIIIVYAVSFFSFYILYQLGTSVDDSVLVPHRLSTDSAELQATYMEARIIAQEIEVLSRSGSTDAAFSAAVTSWEERVTHIEELLGALDELTLNSVQKERLDEISEQLAVYRALSLRVIDAQRSRGVLIMGALASGVAESGPFEEAMDSAPATGSIERSIRILRSKQLAYLTTRDSGLEASIQEDYEWILGELDALAGREGSDGLAEIERQLSREAEMFGGVASANLTIAAEIGSLLEAEGLLEAALASLSQVAHEEFEVGRSQIDLIRGDYSVAMIGIGLTAIVLASLLAQLTSRQISEQAVMLKNVANRMAQGDLLSTAPLLTMDELGVTAQALNEMASRLRHTLDTLEERVALRTAQLDTTAQVAAAVNEERDQERLLTRTATLLVERYDEISHAQIYLRHDGQEENNWAYLAAAAGPQGARLLREGHHIRTGDRSVIGSVLATGEPQLDRFLAQVEGIRPPSLLPESRAEVALPMLRDGMVIGVVDVQSDRANGLKREHLSLLQTLADQLAVGVQNARLLKRTQVSLLSSQRLYEASRAIAQAATAEQILHTVKSHVAPEGTRDVLLFEVHLVDESQRSGYLQFLAATRRSTLENLPEEERIPFQMDEHRTRQELAEVSQPHVIHDIASDPRVLSAARDAYQRIGINALISVAVGSRDGVPVTLQFGMARAGFIEPHVVEQMAGIGSQVGTALQKLALLANLETRAQRLAEANVLAATLLSSTSLDSMFEVAAAKICDLLAVDQVGVVLFDSGRLAGTVVSQYRRDAVAPALGARIPIVEGGSLRWMIDHRAPIVTQDVEQAPLLAESIDMLRDQGIESVLFIPLIVRGEVIGSLGLDMIDRKRQWQQMDVSLAQNVANLLASAIDNNRLFAEVRGSLEQSRILYRTSRAITEAESVDDIAHAIRSSLFSGESASLCLISLEMDAEGVSRARIEGASLVEGRFATPRPRFNIALLPAIRKLRIGRHPLLIPDVEAEPVLSPSERRLLRRLGIRAVMGVPIQISATQRGLILVTYPVARPLTQGDLERLGAIATQAATTLQNRNLLQQTRVSLVESQLLYQAGTHLTEAESYEDVLHALVPLLEPLAIDQIVLSVFDRQVALGEQPEFILNQAGVTLGQPLLPIGVRQPAGALPFLADLESGREIVLPAEGSDDRLDAVGRRALQERGIGTLIAVQLRIGYRYMGWLLFAAAQSQPVPDQTLRLLRNIAQPTAIALEGQRLFTEAQRRAWREEQIARITGRLYTTTDPEEIMQIGLTELQQVLGARRVAGWVQSDEPPPPVQERNGQHD